MTNTQKADIEDAFIFVIEDSYLTIEPENEAVESSSDVCDPNQSPNSNGSIKTRQVKEAPAKQSFVRVDSRRLDTLINLIGELAINHQRVELLSNQNKKANLIEAVSGVGELMSQVQDAALNLRMVPIGESLQRFKRLVRDVSSELNKGIQLNLQGEETELDRSMVEKLTDPLTHIIRNAIDHGIESPDERESQGKDVTGELTISAYHDAGSVVIEIKDDGKGLDSQAIRKKAIEKGLISTGQELSEPELFQLIFHAGFSTAQAVTNLSGRGVGMDVVRRNIEEMHGSIEIKSQLGKGTCFVIRLPLTLAIMDGFHVSVGASDFVIPQAAVIECLDFDDTPRVPGGNKIDLRGELVPYISLNNILGVSGCAEQRREFVIVQFGKKRAGIVVDELHGELKTVVKPLNPIFSSLQGIGGSTLLGSGDVAFILDIPQLIQFAASKETSINKIEYRFQS